jgi:uncharacterized YigZ family protein
MDAYLVPASKTQAEIKVKNSRFIATIGPVFSVAEAKAFVATIRAKYTDTTHNVPAYLIGHGASILAHCSDDGEPSGTAGKPALSILRGSGLGDIAVVVTRYFGGTKLGKGRLVRAYGQSVRSVLEVTPRAQKVTCHTIMIAAPYNWYERLKLSLLRYQGRIIDEEFSTDVRVSARISLDDFPAFQVALNEASHGSLQAEIIETGVDLIPVG